MYVRRHFGSSKMPRRPYIVVPSGWHVVSGVLPVPIVLPLAADADSGEGKGGSSTGKDDSDVDKGLFKGKRKGKPSDIAVQDNTDSDIGPDSDSSPSGAQNDIGKGGSQNPFKGNNTGIGKGGSQNLYLQPGKGLFKGLFKGGMQNPYSTPQQHHEQLAALYGNGTGKAGKAGTGEEIKGKHMGKEGKGKRSRSPWRR
jgi:hypothetical protein